jgi:hypoxanthine phosphoribosyltransferase
MSIASTAVFRDILRRMSANLTEPQLQVLFSREQIANRVIELGHQIDKDYAGQDILLLGVLKGAAIFLADLARNVTVNCTFDFVAVSSYGKGQKTSGAVKLIKDIDQPIEGKHIIVVEDILDTGLTLSFLQKLFQQHKPRSLKIATLLDKPSRRLVKIEADYVGFSIPNQFVVGYGMDYAERFRNLPDICLMPSDFPE